MGKASVGTGGGRSSCTNENELEKGGRGVKTSANSVQCRGSYIDRELEGACMRCGPAPGIHYKYIHCVCNTNKQK